MEDPLGTIRGRDPGPVLVQPDVFAARNGFESVIFWCSPSSSAAPALHLKVINCYRPMSEHAF
jgi:hypothetical protein